MLKIIKLKFILVFILNMNLNAQSASSIDTIYGSNEQTYIQLKNTFILEPITCKNSDKKIVIFESIDRVNGRIIIPDSLLNDTLIISYNYLLNKIPKKIGPRWIDLPELKRNGYNSEVNRNKRHYISQKSLIYPGGNFHRKLSFSPLGGSEFTGGMQIQLNGKLSNMINVNGVITDQNVPFQPDGTTRELDDLDRVFINVSHPNFKINAGDIEFNYINKYNNIKRKLEGVMYNFSSNSFSGSSVYSGSKGEYKTLQIKGRDGDQGPYFLNGKNNNRDIIILSGTDKVWVDGKRMIRGENFDYTIDYSNGEIYFTPRVLITFDTDISFEYQYSDFAYEQGFVGGYLKKHFGNFNSFSIGMYNELDKYNNDDFSLNILDTLKASSKSSVSMSTAVEDINGEYILDGNIFEYDPLFLSDADARYSVAFYFNEKGDYQRKVSNQDKVYYEYVEEINRTNMLDLYSPYKFYSAPKSHQYGYIEYEYQLNDRVAFDGKFSGSKINNNRINNSSAINGGSYNISSKIDTLDFNYFKMNLFLKDWKRSQDYTSLNREEDILFSRLWNLDSIRTSDIRETIIKTDFIVDNFGNSEFEFSRLLYEKYKHTRLRFSQNLSAPTLRNSFFDYIFVNNGNSMFYRSSGILEYSTGRYSPFISFLRENDNVANKFDKVSTGLKFTTGKNKTEAGIDYRRDRFLSQNNKWSNYNDLLGYLNYLIENNNGWRSALTYKKRIKNNAGKEMFNYSLFDLKILYRKIKSPFDLDIQLKKEESFMEKRTVVYDSIGVGLGQYRYDSIFNTYIEDPNGSYIAYNILTGDREPNTNFFGSQKFMIDFSRIFRKSKIMIRGFSKQEYRGNEISIKSFYNNDIDNEELSKIFLITRLEAYHNDLRRLTLWIEDQKLLDGYDPRGNNLRNIFKSGVDISQSISNNLLILNSFNANTTIIKSNVSMISDRKMGGVWNDFRLNYKLNQIINLDLGILGGLESGEQLGQEFFASSIGFTALGKILFDKTGRLQSEITLVQTQEQNNSIILPPEALNGYPIGFSFKTNTRFQYFINKSLSMLFTLNTIDDSRYSNFVTMQCEFRAHF